MNNPQVVPVTEDRMEHLDNMIATKRIVKLEDKAARIWFVLQAAIYSDCGVEVVGAVNECLDDNKKLIAAIKEKEGL